MYQWAPGAPLSLSLSLVCYVLLHFQLTQTSTAIKPENNQVSVSWQNLAIHTLARWQTVDILAGCVYTLNTPTKKEDNPVAGNFKKKKKKREEKKKKHLIRPSHNLGAQVDTWRHCRQYSPWRETGKLAPHCHLMGWLKTNSQTESEWQKDAGWRWRFLRRDQATWRTDARVQRLRQSNLRVLFDYGNHNHTRLSEDLAADRSCCQWMQPHFKGKLRRIPWHEQREKAHKSNPWPLNSVVISLILKYEGTSGRLVRLSEHLGWKQVEPAGLALDAGDESFTGAERWILLSALNSWP